MSNDLIKQSLIDIEQNLRKLESARTQVGNLAGRSEELVSEVALLVKSIEKIRAKYEEAESGVKQNLEKDREKFEKSLTKVINTAEIKSEKYLENQKDIIHKVNDNLKDFQNKLLKAKKSFEDLDLEAGFKELSSEISGIRELMESQHNQVESIVIKFQSSVEERFVNVQKSQNQKFKIILIVLTILLFLVILF